MGTPLIEAARRLSTTVEITFETALKVLQKAQKDLDSGSNLNFADDHDGYNSEKTQLLPRGSQLR